MKGLKGPWLTQDPSRIREIEKKVVKVARLLEKAYGPPSERRRQDPLETLILTILSQNTLDRNRDHAYERLKRKFGTWEAVLGAPLGTLVRTIRVGGLARQKAKCVQETLRWVQERFGKLDLTGLRTMNNEAIEQTIGALKGVGPKTLACLLLFGLKREAFPVDTHILRVGKRIGFIPEKMAAPEAHRWMAPLVPKGRSLSLHLHLIRLGRTVCRARNPRCETCLLKEACTAFMGKPEELGVDRKA